MRMLLVNLPALLFTAMACYIAIIHESDVAVLPGALALLTVQWPRSTP